MHDAPLMRGVNAGFLTDVVPGGPLETGISQMVGTQWNRWRQGPLATFNQIQRGETGWPAECGGPGSVPGRAPPLGVVPILVLGIVGWLLLK